MDERLSLTQILLLITYAIAMVGGRFSSSWRQQKFQVSAT